MNLRLYAHVRMWSLAVCALLAHWPPRLLLSGPVCRCVLSSAVHFLYDAHSSYIICGKHLFTMATSHSVEAWEIHYSVRGSRSIWYSEVITNHSDQTSSTCLGLHSGAFPLCWSFKNTKQRPWIFKFSWFYCDWSEPIFKVIDDIALVESVSANNY